MKLILLYIFLAISAVGTAQTDDKVALQSSQKELQKELSELTKQLTTVTGNKTKSLTSLRIIQDKIDVRKRMIDNIGAEMSIIDRTLTGTNKDIKLLNDKIGTLKKDYAKSIVYAYKNKNSYDFLTFVFSANNFNNAYRRIQYLKEYRNYRQRQIDEIRKYKAKLQGKSAEYEAQKIEKSKVVEVQGMALNELSGEQTVYDKEVKKFTSDANAIAKLIGDIKKRQQKISSQIIAIAKKEELERKKIRDAERKKAQEELAAANKAAAAKAKADAAAAKAKGKPAPAPTAVVTPKAKPTPKPAPSEPDFTQAEVNANSSFESNRGRMNYPLAGGYIRTRFGIQDLGGVKWNNEGTTFASSAPGASVTAIFSGTVSSVQVDDDTKTVYISHGRYKSVYGNLSSVTITVGQAITAGQVIGKCAASEEDASEGLLELMLFRDSKIENPEKWLRK